MSPMVIPDLRKGGGGTHNQLVVAPWPADGHYINMFAMYTVSWRHIALDKSGLKFAPPAQSVLINDPRVHAWHKRLVNLTNMPTEELLRQDMDTKRLGFLLRKLVNDDVQKTGPKLASALVAVGLGLPERSVRERCEPDVSKATQCWQAKWREGQDRKESAETQRLVEQAMADDPDGDEEHLRKKARIAVKHDMSFSRSRNAANATYHNKQRELVYSTTERMREGVSVLSNHLLGTSNRDRGAPMPQQALAARRRVVAAQPSAQ